MPQPNVYDGTVSEEYKAIRDRWDKEDTLLLSRTSIFLMANSVLAAASQFQKDDEFRIGVSILSLVLTTLWMITSWHSANIISALYEKCLHRTPAALKGIYNITPFRIKVLGKSLITFRPTLVFGKLIPLVIFFGWIAYLAWLFFGQEPESIVEDIAHFKK